MVDVRKTVTVLFCDLVGSTALGERTDPEVLRDVMARYHATVREILERHGGTVEKFVGDAAMAVFGLPHVHEDDALRAARAAVEIAEAVQPLALEVRIGVNTGEVVAGSGETLVTGDAVNVAARLEQAAEPGEILVGESTRQLAGDAIRAEPVEPLALKGKSEPVTAHRLVELVSDVPAFQRRIDTPFVGRANELATLSAALSTAIEKRAPQLTTIIGPPGIGKSRLVHELVQRDDIGLLVGRCASYGAGVTFLPLAEMVAQVGDVSGALRSDPERELVAARIEAAFGTAETSPAEIAWGFRKLFETMARASPLVIVLDDIHWAEPTLLDIVEYIVAFSEDAPFLVVCMARPDLFERRPTWAAPRANATLVALEPLDSNETERLLAALGDIDDAAMRRIASTAEGNPLFLEQLVAMQSESVDGTHQVPPTLQALLTARIDRLEPDERAVVERASIEGRFFHRGAVAALMERADVGSQLLALVRKEFIRPDRATVPGDDAFRFGHVLIRDAAYGSMPKRVRADLHERYADWLQSKLGHEAAAEILGFHLEQAYNYLDELSADDRGATELATRARSHLSAAGERAFARNDMPAAANLFERALALPLDDARRAVELGLRLSSALLDVGRPHDADEAALRVAAVAAAAGDRASELRARLFRGQIVLWTTQDFSSLVPLAEEAIPFFLERADDRGLMQAWRLLGEAAICRGRHADATAALERAIAYARRCGDSVDEREIAGWLQYNFFNGSTSVKEIFRWRADRAFEPAGSVVAAAILAMDGDIVQARDICKDVGRRLSEMGLVLWETALTEFGWEVEMQAGDHAAAERYARRGCALYEEMQSEIGLALSSGMLAEALFELGRDDEAWEQTELAAGKAPRDGNGSGGIGHRWRTVRARLLARRGASEAAVELARDALALTETTDSCWNQADAWFALADVFRMCDRRDEATEAAMRSADLYDAKGVVPAAARARELAASLRSPTRPAGR